MTQVEGMADTITELSSDFKIIMDQITLRSPTPIQEDEEDEETDMANQQSIAA